MEEYPAVWEMMKGAKYYESVNTEKFDELKKLFPLFSAKDQRTVKEYIWNNIVTNKGTDEAKILQAFIDKYDNNQKKALLEELRSAGVDIDQKKSPPKNKKIHKEDN